MTYKINNYIYNMSYDKKISKHHFIYKNTIKFIEENKIDDILIVFSNVNDIDCIAIIDELLILKKNIYIISFNKKLLKWFINIVKINKISDLNSFYNMHYNTIKINKIIENSKIRNILISINNYDLENKLTNIKQNEIYKIIKKFNYINKIGVCYDYVFENSFISHKNIFNLDFIITEKKVIR